MQSADQVEAVLLQILPSGYHPRVFQAHTDRLLPTGSTCPSAVRRNSKQPRRHGCKSKQHVLVLAQAAAAPAAPKQPAGGNRLDARVAVVIGTQWGDEGKGKLVDVLAQQYDIVARAQVRTHLIAICKCNWPCDCWSSNFGSDLNSQKHERIKCIIMDAS